MASPLVSIFSHPRNRSRLQGRPKLLIAVTSSQSAILLRGQLAAARRAGFDVSLLSSPGAEAEELCRREHVRHIELPMKRAIAPGSDLISLLKVIKTLHDEDFDIINAGTPKAGLLVTVAGRLTGHGKIIFTLRGLRHPTLKGPKKALVWFTSAVSCRLAHKVICVSHSLRQQALASKLVIASKAVVLGAGSSNGVDSSHFSRTPEITAIADAIRREHKLTNKTVALFVGRLSRDKGIHELIKAWQSQPNRSDKRLLIVGNLDDTDALSDEIVETFKQDESIIWVGFQSDTRPYYAASDFLVLPSYREGFCNVLLEASSMEVPAITSNTTGCLDAVIDDLTGQLVPVADIDSLSAAISKYCASPETRARHGKAARDRVKRLFRPEDIWQMLHNEYFALLHEKPGHIFSKLRKAVS